MAQAKALEASLFGGSEAALDAFGTEGTAAEGSDAAGFWSSLAEDAAEQMVGALWEDRQGEAAPRCATPLSAELILALNRPADMFDCAEIAVVQ